MADTTTQPKAPDADSKAKDAKKGDVKPVDFGTQLANELRALSSEYGRSLAGNLKSVALYTNERIAALRLASGEPGFDAAVAAERDNIKLMAAGRTVDTADEFDKKIFAVVTAIITTAVAAL